MTKFAGLITLEGSLNCDFISETHILSSEFEILKRQLLDNQIIMEIT